MKFKSLFLGMLGAATLISCNNEIDGFDGPGVAGGDGESTTATFQFSTNRANTYAGATEQNPVGAEEAIGDAALFIYKLDGTPEAMAYVSDASGSKKVTVKCKSGDKLIYLAVNIGGNVLVKAPGFLTGTTNSNASNDYLGSDTWDENSPMFDVVNGTHQRVNAPIWSMTGTTIANEVAGAFTPTGTSANNLIHALTANGHTTSGGTLITNQAGSPTGSFYLMTNWGSAASSVTDEVGAGDSYLSTCKFKLEAGISAGDSQAATADETNANKQNALKINVQRALAKVSVTEIADAVKNSAGSGSNVGRFVPIAKWAAGNISNSTYPFQVYDGTKIISTMYDQAEPLVSTTAYPVGGWEFKMDNSRFAVSSAAYKAQTLQSSNVMSTIIANSANVAFSGTTTKNYVYLPENNNENTLNHYSTFVVVAGKYEPNQYVKSVNNVGNVEWVNGTPAALTYGATAPDALDTLYYISSLGSNGIFFHGMLALKQYVCYTLSQNAGGVVNPATDPVAAAYINSLRETNNNVQAELQTYHQGNCFYRIWITDEAASQAVNKKLVRRNHIYEIAITDILGPGIGDPNHIIDPDPSTPDPLEEADTYVTASINVMKWHVINQGATPGLD